jgi:putative ABC transport system permease protein
MNRAYYALDPADVALAAGFVLLAGVVSAVLRLGLGSRLAVGALRTAAQLGLAGLALELVFDLERITLVLLLAGLMTVLAGREALRRQSVRARGTGWDVLIAMSLSAMVVSVTVTGVIVGARPWWSPPVFIPLLGMILGNSLTGISLALERFLSGCVQHRERIEARLLQGASGPEALQPLVREAVRAGMIPTLNAMAVVGVVSLPGMMTGQLLAGADPMDAVSYQIVVMYMLAAATALGSVLAVVLARRRVFTRDLALRELERRQD